VIPLIRFLRRLARLAETAVDGSGIDIVKTAVGGGEEEYRLTPKGVIYLAILKSNGVNAEEIATDVVERLADYMRRMPRPEGATYTGIFRDPESGELFWDSGCFDTEKLY
jgi:hypothetical protein